VPRRHDFILMSKFAQENLLQNEDIYGLHLYEDTNIVDLKRAMMEVERQERRDKKDKKLPQRKRVRIDDTHQLDELFDPEEMVRYNLRN